MNTDFASTFPGGAGRGRTTSIPRYLVARACQLAAAPAPLRWSRLGPVSRAIAARLPTRQPPVLVLGLARSGTSWLSDVLGEAPDALYLYEPLTKPIRAAHRCDGLVYTASHPDVYRLWGDKAFRGIPDFNRRRVVPRPEQWTLRGRRFKRLLIKEVNPLMCGTLVARYRPRVIYLLRHPAGVALSASRLGLGARFFQNHILGDPSVLDGPLAPWTPYLSAIDDPWEREGARQGAATMVAMAALNRHADTLVVRYEEICREPLPYFERLFAFAGLDPGRDLEARVRARSGGGDRSKPYETRRESSQMAQAWRHEIAPGQLAAIRRGYERFELGFYDSPAEWS